MTGKPDGAILAKHEGLHGYVGPAMPQLLKLTAKRVSGSGTMNFTYAVATVDSQFRECVITFSMVARHIIEKDTEEASRSRRTP